MVDHGTDARSGGQPPWQEESVTINVLSHKRKPTSGGVVIISQSVQRMHVLAAQLRQDDPLSPCGRPWAGSLH